MSEKSYPLSPRTQRRATGPHVDDDLKLFHKYNEFVQNEMCKLLIKRKIAQTQKAKLTCMKTLFKNYNALQEKVHKLSMRLQDVETLSTLQNKIDSLTVESNDLAGKYKQVIPMLEKLKTILEPLDVLKCENVKLPEIQEKIDDFNLAVTEVCQSLKVIKKSIGNSGKDAEDANTLLKNFVFDKCQEMEKNLRMLDESITNLKYLALKYTSQYLGKND